MSLSTQFQVIFVLSSIILNVLPDEPNIPTVPMFKFDDPYLCEEFAGTFCFVNTVRRIPRSTRNPRRLYVAYRQELLEWGLCTKECEVQTSRMDKNTQNALMRPSVPPFNYSVKDPQYYFPERIFMDTFFGDLMHVCVNNRLQVLYNVTGYPSLETCITNNYVPWLFFDWFACIFYTVFFSSTVIFAMSNVLDLCGPRLFQRFKIIQALSLYRNWNRLIDYGVEDEVVEIRCIEGLRFLMISATIAFNCFLMLIALPVNNPDKIEELIAHPVVTNVLSCMFWIIPALLTLDGYLTMVHYLSFRENREVFCGRYFRYQFLYRLVESYPLYTMILLYSTIMDTVWGVSPTVGRYLMLTREARFCRRNFWGNLLLLYNFPFTSSEMCYAPGWYLAAHLQLFVLATALLVFTWGFPKSITFVQYIIPFFAIVMPGLGAYLLPSAPLPALQLNDIHTGFAYQTWYRMMYLPTYMNAGGYVAGMLAGYFGYKHKLTEVCMNRVPFFLWIRRVSFPLVCTTACMPWLFYRLNINQPGVFTSIYAILFQNIFCIYLAVCLANRFRNVNGLVYRCIASDFFIIPARLSSCLYFIHPIILRWLLSMKDPREPFVLAKYPTLFFKVYSMSCIWALILFLVVEEPARSFFGAILFVRPTRLERNTPREVRMAPLELSIRY